MIYIYIYIYIYIIYICVILYICIIYVLSVYLSIYLFIYLSFFILFYFHLSKKFRKVFCRGVSKDTIEGNCRGIEQICSCGQEIEISTYFLLHCSNYHYARWSKENWFKYLKPKWPSYKKTFALWRWKLKTAQNKLILTSTIEFLQATERFTTSLFN